MITEEKIYIFCPGTVFVSVYLKIIPSSTFLRRLFFCNNCLLFPDKQIKVLVKFVSIYLTLKRFHLMFICVNQEQYAIFFNFGNFIHFRQSCQASNFKISNLINNHKTIKMRAFSHVYYPKTNWEVLTRSRQKETSMNMGK